MSVADILKANPDIDNPDVIKAGQKIIIPYFKTVAPESIKKEEPEVKKAPAPEEKSWWEKATSWFTGGDEKPKPEEPKEKPLNNKEQEVLNDFTEQLKGIEDEVILETKLPPLPNEECKGCSEKESILKQAGKASEKLLAAYADFAEEYPNLAEHGMSALNIAVQTLVGGPLGAINAVRAELTGAAVGAVAGEQMQIVINAAIEKGAEEIMERDHTVSLVEAKSMATISLYGGMTAAEGAKLGKEVLKEGLKLTKIRPDTVDKVGANYPRNLHYAGETFHVKDASDLIKKRYPNLEKDYPNGVNFDEKGFPDFNPYKINEVKVKGLTGKHGPDFKDANLAAGYKDTPDGYTWHHHEDGVTMQLVPRDLHVAVSHTGGAATIKHGHKVKKESE